MIQRNEKSRRAKENISYVDFKNMQSIDNIIQIEKINVRSILLNNNINISVVSELNSRFHLFIEDDFKKVKNIGLNINIDGINKKQIIKGLKEKILHKNIQVEYRLLKDIYCVFHKDLISLELI